MAKHALRWVALVYVLLLLLLPLGLVTWRTFEHGLSPVFDALTTQEAGHAFQVTAIVAVLAVVCNTVFGVGAVDPAGTPRLPGPAAAQRGHRPAIAVSPVVVGLALILVYGRFEPIGRFLHQQGFDVIYALPGMVLATVFVSLPLVVRAVAPVLEEIGTDQEQAARTLGASSWQTFRRITFPAIRCGRRVRPRAEPRPFHRRVRRGGGGVRPHRRQHPDRDRSSSRSSTATSTSPPPMPRRSRSP